MEVTRAGDGAVRSIVMRDVGQCLAPPGDTSVPQPFRLSVIFLRALVPGAS